MAYESSPAEEGLNVADMFYDILSAHMVLLL